ncbi:hypothetical protein SDC9_159892 [bioreactor metagenome]|uniref:Uncharacterized protein n=1 Tax=bioreactor metagenome TaxID=1076179 RepID=A0A645FJG3_9ZZZZ
MLCEQVARLLAGTFDQVVQTCSRPLLIFLGLVVGSLDLGIPRLQSLELILRNGVVGSLSLFLCDGREGLQGQRNVGSGYHIGDRAHYFLEAVHHRLRYPIT